MSANDPSATAHPSYELVCNRLTIRAASEEEFLAGFEEHFWSLMNSEHPRVTLDLSRSTGMGDDAYRMVALNMFEIGGRGKSLTIRIPEVLERQFKHANLHRKATIEVVALLGAEDMTPDQQRGNVPSPAEAATTVQRRPGASPVGASSLRGGIAPGQSSAAADPLARAAGENVAARAGEASASATASVSNAAAPTGATLPRRSGSSSTVPAAQRTGPARLIDRRTGQVVDLSNPIVALGRVPGNDVLIAMPLVSKRHARVLREDAGYLVEDLGSSNGTYVNGERLRDQRRLTDGDRIQIAITTQYPNGAKDYTFRQDP